VFALIVTKDESSQSRSRARLKQRGWKTMTATPSGQAAALIKENEGVFDVVIVEQKDIGADLPSLIQSVREIEPRIPVFVIADDPHFIQANRLLLQGSTYLCQQLDTECVDNMIDCLGLSSRVKLHR
jgi:DNA-binding NtrC family response regulator